MTKTTFASTPDLDLAADRIYSDASPFCSERLYVLTSDECEANADALAEIGDEIPSLPADGMLRVAVDEDGDVWTWCQSAPASSAPGGPWEQRTAPDAAVPPAPVLSDGTPAVVGLRVCGANWRTDLDCRDIGVIREISPNRVRIAWTGGESINDSPEHLVPAAQMELSGTLCDYETGDALGPATADEHSASREAAEHDGGAGVIRVEGRRCYVRD